MTQILGYHWREREFLIRQEKGANVAKVRHTEVDAKARKVRRKIEEIQARRELENYVRDELF